jgi:hypothetical protein
LKRKNIGPPIASVYDLASLSTSLCISFVDLCRTPWYDESFLQALLLQWSVFPGSPLFLLPYLNVDQTHRKSDFSRGSKFFWLRTTTGEIMGKRNESEEMREGWES